MNARFTFGMVVTLTVFWASARSTKADGQLCSELVASDPATDPDKRNAQLCELVQAAAAVEELAKVMGDAMTSILNAQTVTVDDEPAAGGVEKRKNEYLRFGKRKNEYLRFGKRKNEYLRFGKRKNEYLRFGK